MTSLAERAAAAAGRSSDTPADTEADSSTTQFTGAPAPEIDMSTYEVGDQDPEMIPVHLAWLRVRRDIRFIGKGEQYNGGGTRFAFRGVDTVVNVYSPITLKHGVNILPVRTVAVYRDTVSSKNNRMHECTVTCTWQVMGPMGDSLPLLQTCGEALDSADKATAKAQSVALRELLTKGGMVPTQDPDPDSSYIERGEAPARSAASYVEEICEPRTSPGRLRQIHYELKQARLLDARVTNEVGDEEAIGPMVVRIGKERVGADAS
ncbi:hypothetical protein B4N89_20800 [Embleya scabrispora]|uniref:Uncharacterized protein n=1 Tax=Embleya scabrispora TaxID=159449 RepID=A0A1T3P276_9ACTN|nr:ERF family protein [Embleya scabrispora]OPC83052.1 hypothetical protein B4N89_20800 [Embleya scabrispora]